MSTENQWGVGKEKDAKAFATVKVRESEMDLIFGEHPHSRSDSRIYARDEHGIIEGFDGYRIRTKVEIEEFNYMKESELSGNEIRKGGSCKIYFDDICCWEFFHRNAQEACLEARQIIRELSEHPSEWSIKSSRAALVGRKVYYRDQPAIIESLITSQGCVILIPEGIAEFRPPLWDKERDDVDSVKCDVLDKSIWWFREN